MLSLSLSLTFYFFILFSFPLKNQLDQDEVELSREQMQEAKIQKFIIEAQELHQQSFLHGRTAKDFDDAISSFVSISCKFKLNYSTLAPKLGMTEFELMKCLNRHEDALEEANLLIQNWLVNFAEWIRNQDPAAATHDWTFTIEEILPNTLHSPRPKLDSLEIEPTPDEWNLLLLGDLIEVKDDNGKWQEVTVIGRDSNFLKVVFNTSKSKFGFWVDPLENSTLIRITKLTRMELRRRLTVNEVGVV